MLSLVITVLGLAAFEVISSIDNAVINAEVLGTMKNQRARRFFVTWGLFLAIFAVRGLLPLLIVYLANPSIGLWGSFAAMFSGTAARAALEASSPYLLSAGGAFLLLLFLHWLFIEDKEFGLPHEELCARIGHVWFCAIAAVALLGGLVALRSMFPSEAPARMLAAAVGFAAFFLIGGFKEHAESAEVHLRGGSSLGDWSKVLFLEVIDLAFSVDSVVGAFAFTTLVPLILIGNGVGAIVVRQLTLGNVERIKRYPYLKNGAMYSIGALSVVMIAESIGAYVPAWASPAATLAIVGFHLWLSVRRETVAAVLCDETGEP